MGFRVSKKETTRQGSGSAITPQNLQDKDGQHYCSVERCHGGTETGLVARDLPGLSTRDPDTVRTVA